MTICIEKRHMAGIPLLTCAPQCEQPAPLVFYLHGFTGCKENMVEVGYRLAEAGFFAVLPDAERHGERLAAPIDDLNSPTRHYHYPPGTGFDTYFLMLETALQTARELDTLMDALRGDTRVDTERVGVSGFSMGGFASYFAASSPRIHAAAPMMANPCLSLRWRDLVLEASAYSEWTEAMDALHEENQRRAAWLAEIDPMARLAEIPCKPLLMAMGDIDSDAPKAYAVPLFGALRPRYQACPHWLRLKIYDGVGHTLTNEVIQDMVDWFQKHLR